MSGWEVAALAGAIMVAAFVQGSIGFGFALVSSPVLALIEPRAVPGVLLLLALPMNAYVIRRERAHIDRRGAGLVMIGMVPGTVAGVVVLRAVPADLLTVAFGAAIVVAVAIAAITPHDVGDRGKLIAGSASGLITTVAATGGPAIALIYHRSDGPTIRSTLATAFLASSAMGLLGAWLADRLSWSDVGTAGWLLPAMAAGLAASTSHGRTMVDRRWFRPAVLAFAAASGAAAIVRGVV